MRFRFQVPVRISLPLVVTHVALIAFVTIAMILTMPSISIIG